jgi:transaldolase
LVRQILQIYRNYGYHTEVLAASLRHPLHVLDAALAGAHVGTMPFKVLELMFRHPLTDRGLEQFLKDWEKVKDQTLARST